MLSLGSARCGHIYSHDAIIQHIAGERRGGRREAQCPTGGCSQPVNAKELAPEHFIAKRIDFHKRREIRRTAQSGTQPTGGRRGPTQAEVID